MLCDSKLNLLKPLTVSHITEFGCQQTVTKITKQTVELSTFNSVARFNKNVAQDTILLKLVPD